MKNLYVLIIGLAMVSSSSCLSYLVVRSLSTPNTEMVPFAPKEGATVVAVSGDFGHPLQGFVERALADCGLTVLSSGELAGTVPTDRVRYQYADTTVYRTEREPVITRLFDAPESDYVLRYESTGSGVALNSFSASLLERNSGRVLTTFSRSYAIASAPERVMGDFVEEFRAAAR